MDRDGIKTLLEAARDNFPRLSHVWLDAAYNGQDKGADWVERVLGWSAESVRHPPKLAPEEVMRLWAKEWAKEGVVVDWKKLWYEPITPDSTQSQLLTFRACIASNSTGGRYPQTSSQNTRRLAGASVTGK